MLLLPGHWSPNQAKRQHDPICHRPLSVLEHHTHWLFVISLLCNLPAPAALFLCCSCWSHKVDPLQGPGLKACSGCKWCFLLPTDTVISYCDFVRLLNLTSCFIQYCWELIQAFALLLVFIYLTQLLKKHLGFIFCCCSHWFVQGWLRSAWPPSTLHSVQAVLYQQSNSRWGAQRVPPALQQSSETEEHGQQLVHQQSLLSPHFYPARRVFVNSQLQSTAFVGYPCMAITEEME